ncbi:MAG: hypothetical protein U0V87_00470 [Acidobacteriota bacterium]
MGDIQVDDILKAVTRLVQFNINCWAPDGPIAGLQLDRERGEVTLILSGPVLDSRTCEALEAAVAAVPGVLSVRLTR